MDVEALGFEALERRVSEYAPPIPVLGKTRWERWPFFIGLLGFAVAWVSSIFLVGPIGVSITVIGAAVELLALGVFIVNALRTEIPQLIDAKRKFAVDLDNDYDQYARLIAWLKRFPTEELRKRVSYVQRRRDSMAGRFGLVTGGMHRLGVLPIAVALYLQFKDGIGSLSIGPWQGILIGALLSLYAVSWWLVGFKLRLDLYARVLEDALPR